MGHSCDGGCDPSGGLSRRKLLGLGLGGFLGFAAARQSELFGSPALDLLLPQDGTAAGLRARAKSCIVLWLQGGPPTIDLWDPKPGRDSAGPLKAIDTSLSGVQFGEHLPTVAKVADKIAIVRSMTSREGSHERARYLLHTGYIPTGTVVHPSIGAVASMEVGDKTLDLPNFISINQPTEGAGFLSPEFGPFVVDNPGGPIKNLSYAPGVDAERFRRRLKLLEQQEKDFGGTHASEEHERHKAAYAKAEKLMHTPLLKAFDFASEKQPLREAYGESKFGKGCLLARRLVESGVKFVEVHLNGWDTHDDNFTKLPQLCGPLDAGLGTLIRDLSERDLLKETLVLCLGEFGRTPRINARNGRDHYPKAWSLAMAGGGVPAGRVIGSTDRDGMEVKDRAVTVPDFLSTVYTLLGVDPEKKNVSPQGRPIKLVDGGVPVPELLA